jgi:hypothetical protein
MYRNNACSTVALLVLGFLVALVPLANASPPDPTWIPGIYDDADFDASSSSSSPQWAPRVGARRSSSCRKQVFIVFLNLGRASANIVRA